ncbi:sensor histidine kinase [Rossellomorea sp. BNER]|uniref:sensor histidine kinase n=1 Tax=Rossellomorea sp. BNER TaxID=2962031 RepID=UPI003AF26A2E|nr:HAMP domain-containing histidine kinase [Rossellomorea sp. BNER]
MNLKRKLTIRFSLHFVFMLFVILLFILGSLIFLADKISESEMKYDFTRAYKDHLEMEIKMKNGEIILSDVIKEAVIYKGGWLQIIDKDGKVVKDFNTPKSLPSSYSFTDILSKHEEKFRTHHWILELDNKPFTLLYGEKLLSEVIMKKFKASEEFPKIDSNFKEILKKEHAWIQVYNTNGEVVESYNASKDLKFTFTDILSIEKSPWNSQYDLSQYYSDESDLIYIIGLFNPYKNPDSITEGLINQSVIKGTIIVIGILTILIILFAFWYGNKFGKPLLHILTWINQMSLGDVEEPRDHNGRIPVHNKKGHLHKRYRVFKEHIHSLNTLAWRLKYNEENQIRMEKTREEWITGLSHDLKTPLSSIYGYSMLLDADVYKWTDEEKKHFVQTMKEKSIYMDQLIDDLNLTFRLKNNALPIKMEEKEIVSFMEDIIDNINYPNIKFFSSNRQLYLEIDAKWFTRIMNNLLSNAVKHNPFGTEITVTINHSFKTTLIKIEDNGIGMKRETINKLFDRYYRGGNTREDVNGSGLGMAIAYQLVKAHGGEITVESEEKIGTTVEVVFYNHDM